MHLGSIPSTVVSQLLDYRYTIIFPLAIVEGPILMLVSGFLIRIGFFSFWPAYLLLLAGDLTGDIIWYFVGRNAAEPLIRRYGHFLSLTEANVEKFEKLFHEHQEKILFISKITMGFGFALATLIAAGMAKVPFRKYFAINFLGGFIWTGILVGIGFSLGNFYSTANQGLEWMFIGALVVIGGALVYGFGKAMKKKFHSYIES